MVFSAEEATRFVGVEELYKIKEISNKQKNQYIKLLENLKIKEEKKRCKTLNPLQSKQLKEDGRDKAGKKEQDEVKKMIEDINENNEEGKEIKEQFKKFTNNVILKAKHPTTNNRKTHYDIIFETKNPSTGEFKDYKVEAKGSNKSKIKNPLDAGVQILNSSGNKFTCITEPFIKYYYDNYIINGKLSERFKITSEFPNFDKYKEDQFNQGDPKTEFLKELKKNVRLEFEKKGSLKNDENYDPRPSIKKYMNTILNEEILNELVEKIMNVSQKLKEKDIYLTYSRKNNLDEKYKFWDSNDYKIKNIKDIKLYQDSKDLEFRVISINENNTEFKFNLMFRWGKGCGFSNVRGDFRDYR